MKAYYNEINPFAAAWLRELIKAGLIAPGDVDERDIREVDPSSLAGYTQCHFFAGIGGWSYALRLAGWKDEWPVWTGSCPCQPFSSAGKQSGTADERHLWPAWFRLIATRTPPVLFGEQVSQAINHGWWDIVAGDLEGIGYEVGAADFPACSVGAWHKRQRLYFMAHPADIRCVGGRDAEAIEIQGERAERARQYAQDGYTGELSGRLEGLGGDGGVAHSKPQHDWSGSAGTGGRFESSNRRPDNGGVDDTTSARPITALSESESEARDETWLRGLESGRSVDWSRILWLPCRDGKLRPAPTEPVLFPLAHGISNRVGLLRGAGNAIVPQVTAEFIAAYMEAIS